MGRIALETHTDPSSGQSQSFQYFYDGATPATPAAIIDRGLLTAVVGSGYSKLFGYRSDGSLSSRSLTLNGWRTVQTQLFYFDDGSVRERVVTLFGPDGVALSSTDLVNQVDANGRPTGMLLGGIAVASYAYDGNGQLSSVSFVGGQTAGFRFDGVTRRHVGLDQANGAWTASSTTQLSNRGFLDQESISVGATSLVRSHGYTAEGYLGSAADASISYGYGYDANGQISRIDVAGVSTPLIRTGSSLQAGAVTYQFDGLGRVSQAGDLALSYGPDGHLSGAVRAASSWTFLNDEAGVRLAKLSSGAFVAAYLEEGVLDASGLTQPLRANGTLVGVIANGSFQLIAADTRGTVLADTNGTPRIASPYGDRTQHPDLAIVLDYVQQGFDTDLGVVRMGVRDYDPRIHRFLTPDPLYLEEPARCLDSPVECNLYGYARGNPLKFSDPSGKGAGFLLPITLAESLLGPRASLAQQPPDLSVPGIKANLNSIELSGVTADLVFSKYITSFAGINKGEGAVLSVDINGNPTGSVSQVGDVLKFSFKDLTRLVQPSFSVVVKRFSPEDHTISVVTLQGHPLAGYRYFRVFELDRPDHVIVETGAVDRAAMGLKNELGFHFGAGTQLKNWEQYLQFIAVDSKATVGSGGAPAGYWGADRDYIMKAWKGTTR
jgi:RHS repeat-associated protein